MGNLKLLCSFKVKCAKKLIEFTTEKFSFVSAVHERLLGWSADYRIETVVFIGVNGR